MSRSLRSSFGPSTPTGGAVDVNPLVYEYALVGCDVEVAAFEAREARHDRLAVIALKRPHQGILVVLRVRISESYRGSERRGRSDRGKDEARQRHERPSLWDAHSLRYRVPKSSRLAGLFQAEAGAAARPSDCANAAMQNRTSQQRRRRERSLARGGSSYVRQGMGAGALVTRIRSSDGGEDVVKVPGEMAFEAADGFAFGLAFGLFAGEVGLGESAGSTATILELAPMGVHWHDAGARQLPMGWPYGTLRSMPLVAQWR